MNTLLAPYLVSLIFFSFPVVAQVNASFCGSLGNSFGPYDYRSDYYVPAPGDQESHQTKRGLVDGAHFTRRVEMLMGAQSGGQIGPPGADLDYTLRAFPNHHRALMSVMKYGEKQKSHGGPQGPTMTL